MKYRILTASAIATIIFGCASTNSHKYELGDGKYAFHQQGQAKQQVYVYVDEDSIGLFSDKQGSQPVMPNMTEKVYLSKRSFDLDVLAVPFKFRSASQNLPRQLTTDFNGNIFLGYRFDRFHLIDKKTPIGWKRYYKHHGISVGGFGGLGAAAITPWTTNGKIGDEYSGFVISRGLAVLVGINNLTVGTGIGWDYLTDRDKSIWIYQNKPWLGLMIGLNLN